MAVVARWERPDGRKQLSVTAPLDVTFKDHKARAAEWSLGGLTVSGVDWNVPAPGGEMPLLLSLPFQGFDISFPVRARVTSFVKDTKSLAVDFVDLGHRERDLLCHFLDELVRGSMVPVADTIKRLDAPIVPLSLTPDAKAPHVPQGASRFARAGIMTAIYAALGLVVFGYLASLVHSSIFRFETENAVIAVPSEAVLAQSDGRVVWSDARPGTPVKAGDVVARIYDTVLERDIELAEVVVRQHEARLAIAKRRFADEGVRPSARAQLSLTIARLNTDIDSLKARQQSLEQEARRLGAATRDPRTIGRQDDSKKNLLATQKALETKQLELRQRLEQQVVQGGRDAAPAQLALAQLSATDAIVAQAAQDLEFTRQRHQALVAHRDRLAAVAPFDGIVADLPRGNNAAVRKGDVVAWIEQRTLPSASAIVTARDALKLGLGDMARVHVPATGAFMTAHISQIERLQGDANGHAAPPMRGQPQAFGRPMARVTLTLDNAKLLEERPEYRSGLPVVVQFERRWGNRAAASLRQSAASTSNTPN